MIQGFKEYFREVHWQRMSDVDNDFASNDKEYKKMSRCIIDLESRLTSLLQDQGRKVFDEYTDVQQRRCSLVQEHIYRTGFADGMELVGSIVSIGQRNEGKGVISSEDNIHT